LTFVCSAIKKAAGFADGLESSESSVSHHVIGDRRGLLIWLTAVEVGAGAPRAMAGPPAMRAKRFVTKTSNSDHATLADELTLSQGNISI
jgi:hypothetical protein